LKPKPPGAAHRSGDRFRLDSNSKLDIADLIVVRNASGPKKVRSMYYLSAFDQLRLRADVIAAANVPAPGRFEPADWRVDIETAIHNFPQLTRWEQSFVVSFRGYRRPPSSKQTWLLREIARKIHAAEGRAA
jgi:hypothetical protein